MRLSFKALVAYTLLISGSAFADPNMLRSGGAVIVVPVVTSDAYTIGTSTSSYDGGNDFAAGVVLANTGDTDADTWTLPDCDSAIDGTAPYAPKSSTLGMRVAILNNIAAASALVIAPQALDQIAGLTSAVNKSITSQGVGAYVTLVCAADDLWVPTANFGFAGDAAGVAAFVGGSGSHVVPLEVVGGETVTVAQLQASGGLVTNPGDVNGVIFTLPACAAATIGLRVTVYSSIVTQVLNINPNAADDFQGIETTNAVGDSLENTTTPVIGDSISFYCKTATHWYVDQESTADWVDAN